MEVKCSIRHVVLIHSLYMKDLVFSYITFLVTLILPLTKRPMISIGMGICIILL